MDDNESLIWQFDSVTLADNGPRLVMLLISTVGFHRERDRRLEALLAVVIGFNKVYLSVLSRYMGYP